MRLILQGDIELIVDERILSEYENVLLRPVFGLPKKEVLNVIDVLRSISNYAPACKRKVELPYEGDESFLEVAISTEADAIVTGNKKHFPSDKCMDIKVLSPQEFLKLFLK